MNWDTTADARAVEILTDHAAELYEEAERVAARALSASVSAAYVNEAAFTIRIRRRGSTWPDVILGFGFALLGIAGGVLAVVLTSPSDVHLKLTWVGPVAIGVACLGALLTGVAVTLKLRSD